MAKTPRLLKIAEVAEIIGISRAAVHYAIQHGLLKTEQFGPYHLIHEKEAIRYRDNRPKRGRLLGSKKENNYVS